MMRLNMYLVLVKIFLTTSYEYVECLKRSGKLGDVERRGERDRDKTKQARLYTWGKKLDLSPNFM